MFWANDLKKNEKLNSKIKLSNNTSFVILTFPILKFRNIGRSTFRRSKFRPPPVFSPKNIPNKFWVNLKCSWALKLDNAQEKKKKWIFFQVREFHARTIRGAAPAAAELVFRACSREKYTRANSACDSWEHETREAKGKSRNILPWKESRLSLSLALVDARESAHINMREGETRVLQPAEWDWYDTPRRVTETLSLCLFEKEAGDKPENRCRKEMDYGEACKI